MLFVTRTTIVTVHPLRCHSIISSLLFTANKIALFTVTKPPLNVLPALSPNEFGAHPRADAAILLTWESNCISQSRSKHARNLN